MRRSATRLTCSARRRARKPSPIAIWPRTGTRTSWLASRCARRGLRRRAAGGGVRARGPVVGIAMKIMGEQCVLGGDIGEALRRARGGDKSPLRYSVDRLGEAARTQADADRDLAAYRGAIIVVGKSVHAGRDLFARDGVSVKLSALHSRYEVFHADVAVPTLIARIVEQIGRAHV